MKKNLLLGFWALFTFAGLFCSSVVFGQATLKHSYTFEEGTHEGTTIYDQTGTLDGTIGGDKLTIADGKATVSGATANSDGWISFDGVALALNTYSAITLEAFVETGELLNTSFTMLAYFGISTAGSGCLWIQPTRSGNETRIEANDNSTTITASLSGAELDDGKMHHIVAILNDEALIYYLDGVVVAEATTSGADYISTLGTDVANIFRGVDGWDDPNYNASLEGLYIYEGTLDQNTIALRAGNYLGLDLTNASLDTLTIGVGTIDPAFDSEIDIYDITVPYGTTSVAIDAVPEVGGVTITIIDGLGNEIQDGIVTFDKDDGIDFEVEVTALDGVTKQSYVFAVWPEASEESATLESIELTAGALTTDFNMDDTSYVAIVPPGNTTVDVTGVPNSDNATIEGNGTVTLVDGMGMATLTVISEDGNATMVYTIEIYTSIVTIGTDYYLVHEENGFVAAESGETFNQVVLADAVYQDSAQIWLFEESGVDGQYFIRNKAGNYISISSTSNNAYDLEVYTDLPEIGLDSARFIINEFEPGRFKIISVRRQQISETDNILGSNDGDIGSALFSDKLSGSSYIIWNIKLPEDVTNSYETHLADLAVIGASFKPLFDPAYTTYYATIPVGVTSVEIIATPQDSTSTVTGAGIVDVSDGEGTITILVTASDPQYTREYVIHYLSDTELTLAHSYTFDDGTAQDQVGDADGTVNGGTIADSAFISTTEGDYIILPSEDIALNTYPTITLEAHVMAGENPSWTMLAYFGGSSGTNSYWMSIARNDDISRTELNTGGAVNASGDEPGAGQEHHYVSVLSNDTVYWYVDGSLSGKQALASNNMISKISTAGGWLGYGGYSDPTWLGTVFEFNIYSGQMDAATVAERAQYFLGDISIDATLSSLTVDVGELIPTFAPDITNYSVIVPEGTETVNVSAVPNDERSIVEGDGAVDVSSGSGSAAVLVTAENGSNKTYNIGFTTPGEYSLKHSYTFDEGTVMDTIVYDQVGDADGIIKGGTIAEGAYTAATDGDNIELPAADIAINTYTEITLEGYIYSGVDNTGANMMAYFGGSENNLGGNGYFFTPDRSSESRSAISCGNLTAPWSAEQGVTGSPVSVGEKHHVVSVLTNSSIKWYIDGALSGEAEVSGDNSISALSNANAWLCKGGYIGDPTWLGTIDEFNIYEGELDAATIAEHAKKYLEGSSITLMHSYTFEDGTAADVVGDLDGTIVGNVTIADGIATVDTAANGVGQDYGYISFDGVALALNDYSEITTEAYVVAGDGANDGYTMLYYFGDDAANFLFSQMTEGNSNANVKTTIIDGEEAVKYGSVIDDGLKHHIVAVITSTSLSFYVDGVLMGTATGEGFITPIGTQFAHLFRGPNGWNDDNWIGSFEEFNIYEGVMDAAIIAQNAKEYLATSDARLGALTSDVGSVVPNASSGSTHFAVLVPEGTSSVTLTATPYVSTATVTGDGEVTLTEETTVMIEVTSEDGTVTKEYTVDIVMEDPTCADDLDSENLVADPEMTDLSKWQGWGSKSIVYGHEAYCGGSSMKLGNGGTGCDAALDMSPFDYEPNTTYRVRVWVKTIDGSIGFLAAGADPNFGYAIDTYGEWVQIDTIFTTGANPTDDFISFNKCDYNSNCTYCYIDNYEVFVDNGTSAVEITEATIKVYPTHTTGNFNVKTNGSRGMIRVYNMVGKLVAQKMIESSLETINVRDGGMYIMRVESEGTYKTFKVFKTR